MRTGHQKRKGKLSLLVMMALLINLFSGLPIISFGATFTTGDTWIGTDGQVMSQADASQWQYILTADSQGIILSSSTSGTAPGYTGTFTADGRINGVVPASINGLPVVSLAGTFYGKTALKIAPELPSTVTDMSNTFSGCTNLVSVTIPENVTKIYATFFNCSKLTTVTVPSSVTDMYKAFYGCTTLATVNISENATDLYQTFYNNTALTGEVFIPDSATRVTAIFTGTSKAITMKFSQYNAVAMGYVAPANVTKEMVIVADTSALVNDWIGADGQPMSLNETKVWTALDKPLGGTPYKGVTYIGPIINGSIVGRVPSTIAGVEVMLGDTSSSIMGAFSGNTALVNAPSLPNNATYLERLFYNTTSLTGNVYIPDNARWMTDIFTGTVQPITMFYSSTNTYAASVIVPSNITKVPVSSVLDLENSNPVSSETLDDSVVAEVGSESGLYTLEVGSTVQMKATINRDDLQFRWMIQDLFDVNGESNFYATIDSNGLITGVEKGYALVGLMVKFPDESEHAYGLTLIEITEGGQTGYKDESYYIVSGAYDGGWNYGYGSLGSLGTWFDAYSGTGGLTVDTNLGGGAGTGGTGGDSGSSGTTSVAPYPSESNAVTSTDATVYENSSSVTAALFDKSKNYLQLDKSMQIDVTNLNPVDATYKLVSKNLSSIPSVLINQDGLAVGNYEGVSMILLLDSNNKIVDSMIMYVGTGETIDSEGQTELDNASEDPSDYGFVTVVENIESNMALIGLVEPITTLNITVPLTITFTIDKDRNFISAEVSIVSNCPAPLLITINSVEKGVNAPNLVHENTYTDKQWNNLTKHQASNNIALMLNGVSLASSGSEIGRLKSGFDEPIELSLLLTGKYGKAWNNNSDMIFSYDIILEVEMQ